MALEMGQDGCAVNPVLGGELENGCTSAVSRNQRFDFLRSEPTLNCFAPTFRRRPDAGRDRIVARSWIPPKGRSQRSAMAA